MNFESQLFQYLENLKNNLRTQPMFLGGTASWSGGIGGPPGGFIGYLPQTRVAYDFGELATSGTPVSGMSLWDNLNHIRYRIQVLENGGVNPSGTSTTLIVEEDGTVVASGVTIINFVGANVTETGEGEITVSISSSGVSSSGISVESFTDISTLHFSGATVTNPSSNEVLISIDIPTASGGGDMYKSVYDTNNDGIVDQAASVPWSGITNVPSVFPPDAHTHDDRYYTKTELQTSGQASVHWGNITNVPDLTSSGITDAPIDGSLYGRQDGEWEIISVSGIDDAPADNNTYGRKNNSWVTISGVVTSGIVVDSSSDPFWFIDGYLDEQIDAGPSFIIPRNCTITNVYIWGKTLGTAGNTIVDINKNGSSIFTTQANRPTLAYNATSPTKSSIPDIVALQESDIITIDLDSVATGAKDLTVLVALEHSLAPQKLPREAVFLILDTLETNYGKIKLYNLTGQTLTLEKVFLSVNTAPQGSSIIADINKNGTTIFTTQTNRPTILESELTGYTTTLDITTWEDGSYLTMDIDQIGSSTPGADLTCIVVGR